MGQLPCTRRSAGSTDIWAVLCVGEHTVKVMRDDRLNPTTVEVAKSEVSAHIEHTKDVHEAYPYATSRPYG